MLEVEVTKEVASIFSAGTWQSSKASVRHRSLLNGGNSSNGGFPQQPWVFLLTMIILGCEMGVPPFKETPKYLAVGVGTSMIHAKSISHFFADPVS